MIAVFIGKILLFAFSVFGFFAVLFFIIPIIFKIIYSILGNTPPGTITIVKKVIKSNDDSYELPYNNDLGKKIMDYYYSDYNISINDISEKFNIPISTVNKFIKEYSKENK